MLRGVDRAAFAVALVARLRSGSVAVAPSGAAALVAGLAHVDPRTRRELYWTARLTLVNRADDLAAFDAVFETVFADAVLGLDPPSLKAAPGQSFTSAATTPEVAGPTVDGAGLPWTTRPASITGADADDESPVVIPEVLPSRLSERADESFDSFDEADLRLLGAWLEQASAVWPRRRTLRAEAHRHGARVDLRRTLRDSRGTGWEPLRLARTRRRERPRRVVFLCDVSRSMQPYASVYLHLMRSALLHAGTLKPEVFAFATSLHRLTPTLAHRSAEVALARANSEVSDRYGGTHLGGSVAGLLSGPQGNMLRGAVVIIASDGWDSDPPEYLAHAMARLRRRAHTIIWLNPRAAAPGYMPLAGPMAAALPFCDLFLPANTLSGVRDLLAAVESAARPGRGLRAPVGPGPQVGSRHNR